jgi:1,2-diacylglycerol 3-alpha-glucosyltransferase
MRVMLFADTYPPQVNGVATSVSTLALSLSEQGHAVMVCTVGSARQRNRTAGEESFAVIRKPAMPVPLYTDFTLAAPVGRTFTRLVRRFRPDVIHCHTPFSIGWQGARAAAAHDVPLVGTHHTLFGEYVDAYFRFGHQVNRRIAGLIRRYVATFYNQCDLISCASRFLANDVVSGGLRQPVSIVPNPVNADRFCPLRESSMGCAEGQEIRLIYFGRLAAEKNLPYLVTLVEPVLRRHPEVRLDIVGDGPMMATLVDLARQRSLERQVRFLGWLHGEALARRVALSDICVSASLTENQPMALLESLASGVPVVALAAAGVPEIIQDGCNGYLIAPVDATGAFARRLEQLIVDPAVRTAMSQRAHTTAQAYSQHTCRHLTLRSYEDAITMHHKGRRAARWPDPRELTRRIPRLRG